MRILPAMMYLFLSVMLFTACQSTPQGESYVLANVDQFEQMMEDEPGLLIDVRTPGEFAAGHLEGAINIDYYAGDFYIQMNELDKNQTVYVYCGSGNRSGKACNKLLQEENKFVKLVDLDGGIADWEAQSKPIVQ